MTRRNSRGKRINTRKRNGGASAEQMEIWKVPMVVADLSFQPENIGSEIPLIKGRSYKILGKQEAAHDGWVLVKDTVNNVMGYVPMSFLKFDESKKSQNDFIVKVKAKADWSKSGQIIPDKPDNRYFLYPQPITITKNLTYITFPALEISGPKSSEGIYYYGGPQGGTLDKFGYFPERLVDFI